MFIKHFNFIHQIYLHLFAYWKMQEIPHKFSINDRSCWVWLQLPPTFICSENNIFMVSIEWITFNMWLKYLNALGLRPAMCDPWETKTFCNINNLLYVFSATAIMYPKPPSSVATSIVFIKYIISTWKNSNKIIHIC